MTYAVGTLIVLFLWAYCLFDIIGTDGSLTRNLPKHIWLLLVIFIPLIGSVAWLTLGRPMNASFYPGSTEQRGTFTPRGPGSRSLPPDDSPEFLSDLEERRLRAWEADLKRREEELRRKDDED